MESIAVSSFKYRLLISPILILSLYSHATDLDLLQKNSLSDQQQSEQAQQAINELDDQKLALIKQVEALESEAQSLEVYNQYVARLIADQSTEKLSLNTQITSVAETRQGLVPLMLSMLETLASFIELDAPFLLDERKDRLLRLQAMMDKADVSDAEKFRRILTAYHIEAEYGNKMGEYQASLTVDEQPRTVNYFYLGRVVFVAVSLDSKHVWLWDRVNHDWRKVDSGYARDINKAIRIAQKTDIPALLKLPLLSEVN